MSTAHATKLGNWQMVYSWKGALSVGDVQVAYQIKKSFCFFVFFFYFDGFLSNFWANISRNYGKRFGKSRATWGKPHWWCHMITHDYSLFVAVLNNALLIVFVFESWYHFLPYIWIMIALCSILGIVAGMIVLHSPHAVARRVLPEEKEFALGLLTVGNAVGAFVAGFAGLAVEPFLTAECKQHFPATSVYCFTRVSTTSGWDTNIHCS